MIIQVLRICLVVLAACIIVGLLVVIIRRQWLLSRDSIFSCEICRRLPGNGSRWALGVARYCGDNLLWYKLISLSFRPTVTIRRSMTRLVDHRQPSPQDRLLAINSHLIARLEVQEAGKSTRIMELGLANDSLMGLMSWLEASPPGGASYCAYD